MTERPTPERGPRFEQWRSIYAAKLRDWQSRPVRESDGLYSHVAATAIHEQVAKLYHVAHECAAGDAERDRLDDAYLDFQAWLDANQSRQKGRKKGAASDIAGEAVLCLVHRLGFSQRAARGEVLALATDCGIDVNDEQVRKAVARWKAYARTRTKGRLILPTLREPAPATRRPKARLAKPR